MPALLFLQAIHLSRCKTQGDSCIILSSLIPEDVCVRMKSSNLILTAMALLMVLLRPEREASAFHDGGVGPCDACHAMHAASGQPSALLKASDPGSTCLNCHQQEGAVGPNEYQVSTPLSDMPPGFPPRQLTPGGDFGWLRKTYTWTAGLMQAPQISAGDRHGHNIVANDYFYASDALNSAAPGGVYPSTGLTCISCHDPHGKYRRNADGSITASGAVIEGSGSYALSRDPLAGASVGAYRLLGGKNYQPRALTGNFGFVNDPPAAVAPADYNRSEDATLTRVAYGSGMSEWCQNCHLAMHTIMSTVTSSAPVAHPSGSAAKLGLTVSGYYNAYIKTGDLSGTAAASFLSLVPFEEGTANYLLLKSHARSDDSFLAGPDPVIAQVMCLTCHRAHASGWDGATRWNMKTDLIVSNGFYSQEGQTYQPYGQGRTEREAQKAYYEMKAGRFALNQDTLCYKCHTGALL